MVDAKETEMDDWLDLATIECYEMNIVSRMWQVGLAEYLRLKKGKQMKANIEVLKAIVGTITLEFDIDEFETIVNDLARLHLIMDDPELQDAYGKLSEKSVTIQKTLSKLFEMVTGFGEPKKEDSEVA